MSSDLQREAGLSGRPSRRYPAALLAAFGVVWVALAIHPLFRQDWLLENMLVFIAVPILVATSGRLRFSNVTYTCLFAFFCLHEIGAHYTYSLVPYDDWMQAVTGHRLNDFLGWQRNHYDRLLHFLYGLLVAPAAIELFAYYGRYARTWAFLFPFLFMASHSVVYELVEWAAAVAFGGDLGQAYLGTQGDIWDAQRDMAFAMLGSLLTTTGFGLAGRLPVGSRKLR
jgi:putative membrane protein